MKTDFYAKCIKRVLDFLIALGVIVILSPLLVLIAIMIKLDSQGTVLFTQERPGKNREIFKVYKFRTMVVGAEKAQKVGVEVMKDDARITSLGYFLRRFKIDELAQLFNILKGDMSIVGPRPTLPEYIEQYEEWELKRFDVRPGLTGLAQVNGNIYLERIEKSKYDVAYVENINFLLDVKIVIKTIAIVICGEEKFVKKKDD